MAKRTIKRGTNLDNLLRGGARRDILFGLGGNDRLLGNGGNDILNGGAGNDLLTGGDGNDVLNGGAGNDTIQGDGGNDRISGGNGSDTIEGGAGRDVVSGGNGNDNIQGGDDNDRLLGDAGNDLIAGDRGDDVMIGGAGDDTLDWDDGDGSDLMSGNEGRDTIEVDGSITRGDNFVLGKNSDGKAFFQRVGLDGQAIGQFSLTVDTSEIFDVSGDVGNDTFIVSDSTGTGIELIQFNGGAGNDTLNGENSSTRIEALGGDGDDTLGGSSIDDTLQGDAGNDTIVGNKGNDTMIGGAGDDTLDWDDGDGSDIMSGNEGRDTIEVDGSVTRGDNFVLGKNPEGKAFFQRVGLDGQAIGQFSLTVDTSEIFDVSGDAGNDTFIVNDLSNTGVEVIQFDGGAGNDTLDARNTSTQVVANGGDGDDLLVGGTGTIVGANNATLGDRLTGGSGRDRFQFSTDPFAGGVPGQNVNRPDVVTDFAIGEDQIVFDRQRFGISQLNFQKGNSGQLSGDSNLLVLTDGFANAGAAAAAIRNNNQITAGRGAFVYFNQTLGISRVVFSEDLANGGRFSVQANLANLTNVANQANFSASDFGLA